MRHQWEIFMSVVLARLVLGLGVVFGATAADAACYDLRKSEPHELTGVLSYRIFAGPPNYEDVQKGDTPEPGYVLTLPAPICLEGDEFADPANRFNEVQLVATEQSESAMRSMQGMTVTARLERQMPAHTGHHHRPLVAWVTSLSPAEDVTSEYGTAASTVRAFYYALAAGDGATAANYVVAEKRKKGAFSAAALGAFYGNLREPLTLADVKAAGPDEYLVHYRFASQAGVCDGKAIVKTIRRDGTDFIRSIKALNGC
jgi:hypothetical protein